MKRWELAWKDLCYTYYMEPHCFVLGCGKDTLSYWVRNKTGRLWSPRFLRRILMGQHYRGHVEVLKKEGACTKFWIKSIRLRKEHYTKYRRCR